MKRITGILLIAISAASFGTLAIFGRYAYAAGMDIFTVLFLRFTISVSICETAKRARSHFGNYISQCTISFTLSDQITF